MALRWSTSSSHDGAGMAFDDRQPPKAVALLDPSAETNVEVAEPEPEPISGRLDAEEGRRVLELAWDRLVAATKESAMAEAARWRELQADPQAYQDARREQLEGD